MLTEVFCNYRNGCFIVSTGDGAYYGSFATGREAQVYIDDLRARGYHEEPDEPEYVVNW